MSMDFVRLGEMVLLANPTAVGLLVWMDDFPWGHFISMRVWRRGTMYLAVIKRVASSASVAEDMTKLIIWEMVRMGTLYLGLGSSSDREICAPERLPVLEKLRYAASEWSVRRMSLAL